MKKYKQLVRELPSKKVVFAFGRFQPPGKNHGLVFAAVKHLATAQGADHIIYASRSQDKKSNPLPVDRKVYWLNRMFPKTNFVGADDSIRTFIEAAKHLNKKYKNLVMVAGSDRVSEFQTLLDKYNGKEFNFDTIEVVSAGERDPDSEGTSGMSGTKMRDAAKNSDVKSFKRGLPSTVTTIDAKRLMNELREYMGLEVVKEDISFDRNELREQYLRGEVFLKGEFVQDEAGTYEIVDRGTNYLTVVNESGELLKKWIHMVHTIEVIAEDIPIGYAPKEITFKGYTTKNLHHSPDATKAFQTTIERLNKGLVKDPIAVLNALKATDTYMKLNDVHLAQGKAPDETELASWNTAHAKAKDSLERSGEYLHHMDYWKQHETELQGMLANYTPATAGADMNDSYNPTGDQISEMKFNTNDRIKVARVIATALGITDVDKMSNPAQLVNNGLRKIRNKPMRPEYVDVIHHMLQTATEAGIEFDPKLVPNKVTSVAPDEVVESAAHKLVATKLKNIQSLKDFSANTERPKVQTFVAREFQKDKKEVAEGKCGEGKCGTAKKKMEEEASQDSRGFVRGEVIKAKDGSYFSTSKAGSRKQFDNEKDAKKHAAAGNRDVAEEVEFEEDETSDVDFLYKLGVQSRRERRLALRKKREQDELGEEVELEEGNSVVPSHEHPYNRPHNEPSISHDKLKSGDHGRAPYNRIVFGGALSKMWHGKNKIGQVKAFVNSDAAKKHALSEEVELDEDAKQTHQVTVTISDPNHTMVGKRKETIMKKATVKATDPHSAVERVKQHYTKAGYKVHDVIHGGLHEACWDTHKQVGMKKKGNRMVPDCVPVDEAAVDAKGHKSSTGGLTQKGRDHYNSTTGGNLKAPVTTPPSKLDPDSKAANRRKSFCARMGGMEGPMKKPNGEPTRKSLALKKWNCNEEVELEEDIGHTGMSDQERKLLTLNPNAEVKTDLPATTTKAKAKKKLADFTSDKKDNESDMDADVAATTEPEAVMGMHMVTPYASHSLRRMKINYATHSEAFDPALNEVKDLQLFKYNKRTGYWTHEKTISNQNDAKKWLDIFKEDEPNEHFMVSKNKPNHNPMKEAFDPFFNDGTKNNIIDEEDELDLDDAELDKMAKEVNHEDDILDAYDDHELGIIDDETGEEIEKDVKEELETMNEVLSRAERLKSKVRFARSSSKRARKTKLALKSRSSAKTLNSRARKLAVNLIKKRIARKPLDKLTLGEKERIEKIISKKKVLVNRLAMRLVSRVKKIETDRLSHKKYTK